MTTTAVTFLTDAWLDAMVATSKPPTKVSLVLQQHVGSDSQQVSYWMGIGTDGVEVTPGTAEAPTITFSTDPATAAGLNQGTTSALTAFLEGDLKVTGEVQGLVEHRELLAGLDDHFAELRSRTSY
jgi:hypothetical protein